MQVTVHINATQIINNIIFALLSLHNIESHPIIRRDNNDLYELARLYKALK
jgi:hypothetical protein